MKFKSLLAAIAVLFVFSTFAMAQDEINRAEFFGGYSHNFVDSGISSNDSDVEDFFEGRSGHKGFNFSITGNVSKYVGIKFDVASHTKTFDDSIGTDPFSVKSRNTTFMGGLQFKNNMKDGPTVKPFAHILAGVAKQKLTSADFDEDFSDNNFTMAFGAGIDVKVHKHVDIRLIQLDYNPVFRSDDTTVIDDTTVPPTTVTFGRQNNMRVGFGIVIH
jgi:opacity protein-like surface antigen